MWHRKRKENIESNKEDGKQLNPKIQLFFKLKRYCHGVQLIGFLIIGIIIMENMFKHRKFAI